MSHEALIPLGEPAIVQGRVVEFYSLVPSAPSLFDGVKHGSHEHFSHQVHQFVPHHIPVIVLLYFLYLFLR